MRYVAATLASLCVAATATLAWAGDASGAAAAGNDGAGNDKLYSFRNDVLPVLTKAGCNSGACHGALAGKGGFKLSLRGYDPSADHYAITREARGRRLELASPGQSLLLAKPTGALPHKGGVRFEVDSREYAIVSQWIAQGALPPTSGDRRLLRIAAEPAQALLKTGDVQALKAIAHYADGPTVDVTPWVKFSSVDESVARVDDRGRVEVVGHGEGTIVAWFASHIATSRITSPFDHDATEADYVDFDACNFVDERVLAQLKRLKLAPSPLADEAEFHRRVWLDTVGRLPEPDAVRRYLADSSPDKRERLIDALLTSDAYVDYWAYRWSDLLLVNGNLLRPQAVKAYYGWIREQVARNTPWDELARQVTMAQGSSVDQGATNFYALHQDAESITENICQAFLGLSIGCARCHNHPLEKWTNDQYYAMANLFSRVRAKGWGGNRRGGDGARTIYVAAYGDLVQPLKGKAQPPTPLDGEPLAADQPGDRRAAAARWLAAPENPYFTRAIVNRVWANFFGVGLVEPVDDLRASNPASNEELLNALAEYLVANDYDLKRLMRVILASRTYASSSRALPKNEAEARFYSRYYPRRMMAEPLLDAISQVAGVDSKFTQLEAPDGFNDTDAYPAGTRALQLFDSAVASSFLKVFGRNTRNIVCECERTNEPSMVQSLHLANGDTIHAKLRSDDGRVKRLLDAGWSDYRIIEELYLAALCRYPTDQEMRDLLQMVTEADDRRLAVEDLFWSVLSSREFLFHH